MGRMTSSQRSYSNKLCSTENAYEYDSLDERIHLPPQLSDFVPLRNWFYSFRAQTD